jgi:TIR domain
MSTTTVNDVSPTTTNPKSAPFDVFISYRSSSSGQQARNISRALFALSRRHLQDRNLRIFLDASALSAGNLDDNITQALDRSRSLVVCLDKTTIGSPWVAKEIEYWLSHGGSSARLFLARTDDVDLRWDQSVRKFANEQVLPEPLRDAFSEEQKYFDVPAGRTIEASSLAGLYAAIMEMEATDLLVDEAEFQRRRRRLSRAVITALAVLLVLAIVAGVVAVYQSRRSAASARTAQGEAAAAGALLTLPYSYTESIDQVLDASTLSDSSSVRSALIAVAGGTGALRRSVDWSDLRTGHPATGTAFSRDGHRLIAWGPASTNGRSHLGVWSVISGELLVDTDVDVAALDNVIEVGSSGYLGCNNVEPVLIDRRTYAAKRLAAVGSVEGDGVPCATHSFAGGGLVETLSPDNVGQTTYVSYAGKIRNYRGASVTRLDGEGWSVPLQTAKGLVLVSAKGSVRVSLPGIAEVRLVSAYGTALVRADGAWYTIQHEGNGSKATVNKLPLPSYVAAVSLYSQYGGPGGYAWIDKFGQVGFSGSQIPLQLFDIHHAQESAPSYGADILPMGDGALLAIIGKSAYRLTPPDEYADTWSSEVVTGLDPGKSESAVADYCDTGELIRLADGHWLVSKEGSRNVVQAASEDAYRVGCALIDPGPPLAVDGVKISDGALDGDVTVAGPDTPQVAIFRPTAPTQILSTGGHRENVWRAYNDASIVSALGERRIVSASGKVTSTPAGLAPEVLADAEGEIRGVSPDGREGFIATTVAGRTTFQIAGRGQIQPGCKAERVEYLPGRDFASNVADAQLQTPAYRTEDGSLIDCRSGQAVRIAPNVTIDDYQIGSSQARIVWTRIDDQRAVRSITQWEPNRPDTLHTRELPAADGNEQNEVRASFDKSGDHLLMSEVGSGTVRSWSWSQGKWIAGRIFAGSIGSIYATAWNSDGTLIFTFGKDGAFELYDVATGRRLITNLGDPQSVDSTPRAVGIVEVEGFIYAHIVDDRAADTAGYVVEVPIRIDRLRELLCVIHRAPACNGVG